MEKKENFSYEKALEKLKFKQDSQAALTEAGPDHEQTNIPSPVGTVINQASGDIGYSCVNFSD